MYLMFSSGLTELRYLQRYYEKEFSSLLQKMRDPPSILARARFLMGSAMGGGGITTMCEVGTLRFHV